MVAGLVVTHCHPPFCHPELARDLAGGPLVARLDARSLLPPGDIADGPARIHAVLTPEGSEIIAWGRRPQEPSDRMVAPWKGARIWHPFGMRDLMARQIGRTLCHPEPARDLAGGALVARLDARSLVPRDDKRRDDKKGNGSKESVKPGNELDFWVGTWKVYSGGHLDGVDVVEKEVAGFAVIDNWKDAGGSTGKSLFYYMPAKKQWKQVWVTEAGVYKEKFSEPLPNGIRFSGHVFLPDGREIRDRTTLTRMPGGDVHQVIEFTKDGKKWQTTFDAIYKRAD